MVKSQGKYQVCNKQVLGNSQYLIRVRNCLRCHGNRDSVAMTTGTSPGKVPSGNKQYSPLCCHDNRDSPWESSKSVINNQGLPSVAMTTGLPVVINNAPSVAMTTGTPPGKVPKTTRGSCCHDNRDFPWESTKSMINNGLHLGCHDNREFPWVKSQGNYLIPRYNARVSPWETPSCH